MNFDDMYPSRYLKAADVATKPLIVVIESVAMEQLPDGTQKSCIEFRNQMKGFLCNRTNASLIAATYGGDTEAWIGKSIVLYQEMVAFKGKVVPSIRVRVPQVAMPQPVAAGGDEDFDDDINF